MRVALYARVSTDEQKQGRTIDSQLNELESFARAHDYGIVERYVDDGWSGSLLNRPALDRIRDDAERGSFEAVVLTDVDRLSRDLANLAVVKRDLENKGVSLIFQKLPADGSPLANFMVNILGSFAEFERALIADRTRRGRRFKVQERQVIMGNLPPYGYNYVKKDRQRGVEGHYLVNPEEARVVRLIYSSVTEDGLSQRAAVRRLNELGIPPRHGRAWARSSVHRILTNETYAGITYYNKNRAEGPSTKVIVPGAYRLHLRPRLRPRSEWIPIALASDLHIIDRPTYERAQAQLRHNRALASRNVKYFYLLRGVRKVCGRCSAAYVGTPYHGRPFYRCSKRDAAVVAGSRCRAKIISARKIEAAIWQVVQAAVLDPKLIIDQVNTLQVRSSEVRTKNEIEVGSLRQDLAAIAQEEERVLLAYRTAVTNLEQFSKEMAKITNRRGGLNQLLQEAERRAPALPPGRLATRDIRHWSAVIRGRMKSFDDQERQRFLGHLLNEIVIDGDVVRVRGEIPAHSTGAVEAVPTAIEGRGHNVTPDFARSHLASGAPNFEVFGGRYGRNATWPFEFVLHLNEKCMRNAAGAAA